MMPMDPERKVWFDSIRACPEDDTLRLVFADWLQERGEDTRAEMIRGGVRFAMGDTSDHGTIRANHWFWDKVIGDRSYYTGELSRGILVRLTATWRWWLANGDRITATEWVPEVRLATHPEIEYSVRTTSTDQHNFTTIRRTAVCHGDRSKVCAAEIVYNDREIKLAKFNFSRDALERLERRTAPAECLKVWWPDTKFILPDTITNLTNAPTPPSWG